MATANPPKWGGSVIRDADQNKNQENYQGIDMETVELVKQVKAKLQKQMDKKVPIEESDVEFATFDTRREENTYCNDMGKWKKSISHGGKGTDLFDVSAAYAKTEDEIRRILQEKQQQFSEGPASYPKRKYVESSLNNIIPPLKEWNNRKSCQTLQELFEGISRVRKESVLRADRMFFTEVTRLAINGLEKYTIENAHDQVQAICLMHYKPKPDDRLSDFVRNCRTFESAYAHLQNLVNEQSKQKSELSREAEKPPRPNRQHDPQSGTSPGSQHHQHNSANPDSSHSSTGSQSSGLINSNPDNSKQNRQSLGGGRHAAVSADTRGRAVGNNSPAYQS